MSSLLRWLHCLQAEPIRCGRLSTCQAADELGRLADEMPGLMRIDPRWLSLRSTLKLRRGSGMQWTSRVLRRVEKAFDHKVRPASPRIPTARFPSRPSSSFPFADLARTFFFPSPPSVPPRLLPVVAPVPSCTPFARRHFCSPRLVLLALFSRTLYRNNEVSNSSPGLPCSSLTRPSPVQTLPDRKRDRKSVV